MKKKNFFVLLFAAVFACLCLFACGMPDGSYGGGDSEPHSSFTRIEKSADTFSEITERGFVSASEESTSAFALTTSRSSYTYMRRSINSGRLPAKNSVRIEEYINYFDYDVASPESGDFAGEARVFDCPWNDSGKLMRFTLASREVQRSSAPVNLVFLVDVSASMHGEDRIGLLKTSLLYAVEGLGEDDCVSLVTYAGASEVVFDGLSGKMRDEFCEKVDALQVGGNTAGFSALEKAYSIARKHYTQDGNNAVILFTDGDFNVGISSPEELESEISEMRDRGISFTAVGVGHGNLRDDVLESLANAGGGKAYYLDSESEARRIFGEELTGALQVVARDAKAQVAFDSSQVAQYRLIGYDNRALTGVEFEDAATASGEIGSGMQVTALYEVILAQEYDASKDFASLELRYTNRDGEQASYELAACMGEQTDDDIFISCVAQFGLLLRGSAYCGNASFEAVCQTLGLLTAEDPLKSEFVMLARSADGIYKTTHAR